jgi:hypothetical protein
MNEFGDDLRKGAQEVRIFTESQERLSPSERDAFEQLAQRMERASNLESGLAIRNEIFDIAQDIKRLGRMDLDAAPSFKQVLETLLQRTQRANSCCRR